MVKPLTLSPPMTLSLHCSRYLTSLAKWTVPIWSKAVLIRKETKAASQRVVLILSDETIHKASRIGCQSNHSDVHLVFEGHTPGYFSVAGLLFWGRPAFGVKLQPAPALLSMCDYASKTK